VGYKKVYKTTHKALLKEFIEHHMPLNWWMNTEMVLAFYVAFLDEYYPDMPDPKDTVVKLALLDSGIEYRISGDDVIFAYSWRKKK